MDDIFKTIKLISSYLPKNKFSSILSQNLNSNHLIKSNIVIKKNIPPPKDFENKDQDFNNSNGQIMLDFNQ